MANRQDIILVFEASDGSLSSTRSTRIVVEANLPPVAAFNAPNTISAGQTVTLDGTPSSDPEGDALVYRWEQTAGPPVTLNNANSAIATFTAPASTGTDEVFRFRLTVTDTFDASGTRNTAITLPANSRPVPDAGPDQSVSSGSTVTLDGSGSTDPEGDAITYEWVQTSGPTVTLSDNTVVNPTFTAPDTLGQDVDIEFSLTVRDATTGTADLVEDTVTITVLANRPPTADAGPDQGPIDSGQTVTLDGTGSADPDGDQLFYTWVQVSGTPVTLSDPSAAQPTFTAPSVMGNESLEFSLTVTDVDGQVKVLPQQIDNVVIEVRAVGSITLIPQITGRDTQVSFTSDVAALDTTVATSGGTAQVTASSVAAGSYNVSVADLSADGYVITAINCNDTDSVVSLSARSVAIELSANEDLVCTFSAVNSRETASAAIYNFLTGRNALILSHQPDLQRRLDRLSGTAGARAGSGSITAYGVPVPGSERLPVQAEIASGSVRVSSNLSMALGFGEEAERKFDVWTEAYFSRASIGQQDGDFRILYIGADVKVGESLLIGALVQQDKFSDRGNLDVGEAEGDGWMAGPYLTARLGPNFYAEARAAWGRSENTVSPLPGQVDAFDTSRSYYAGSLIGQFDIGQLTTFRPEVTVRYLSEKQAEYTDGGGVVIPSQTVAQGDVSFRPRVSHMIAVGDGWTLRPFAEVEGIYTFGTDPDQAIANALPVGFSPVLDGLRGRVEGGFDLLGSGGLRATLSGFHDGIGSDDFASTGVHVGVSFSF
ncbi:Chitinase A precursor [Paraurantiacibacter namhicola]|uniref:Chitinase A n=2 Tax=Paraurantiacibacter namhicola TaxID=645517 RepID=A0A1C7DBB2_9SPHN|nr:Chitinase A precursor [Paraurantiacibacter namhicola]